MKKNIKCTISLVLVASLAAFSLAGCGSNTNETKEASTTKTEALSTSHSSDSGKEETVYVFTDGTGKTDHITVSNWLKNGNAAKSLKDYSTLSDIKNVNGNETFTKGTDNSISWNTNGGDIYYQGTSDKELPVDMHITYTLDGKEISADNVKDITGKLEIEISYTNNTYDSAKNICQPFLMINGTIFDNESATDIEVTNGKVINDGNRSVIMGAALPGMSKYFDEVSDKITIPDKVTIKANVKDFSMPMLVTIADNNLLHKVDLEKVGSVDELESALNKLNDSSSQLVDGSAKLSDGLNTLSSKTGVLSSGVTQLNNGAKTLKSKVDVDLRSGVATLAFGTATLNNGAIKLDASIKKLNNGTHSLHENLDTLNNGINSLDEGITAINGGLSQLDSNSSNISGGSQKINDSLLELKKGLNQVKVSTNDLETLVESSNKILEGIDTLTKGLATLAEGTKYDSFKATAKAKGLDIDVLKDSNTQSASSIDEACKGLTVLSTDLSSHLSDFEAMGEGEKYKLYLAEIDGLITGLGQIKQVVTGDNLALDAVEAYMGAMNAGATDAYNNTSLLLEKYGEYNKSISQLASKLTDLAAGMSKISSSVAELSGKYSELNSGIKNYTNSLGLIMNGYSSLIDGSSQLVSGSSQLLAGSEVISNGTEELSDGSSKLAAGAAELNNGTGTLTAAIETLSAGVETLSNGTSSLAANTPILTDGIEQLRSGAETLKNGMLQFDSEGIKKLTSVYQDNIKGLINKLKDLKEYSDEYTTFSGCDSSIESSVKFIYKTEAVK